MPIVARLGGLIFALALWIGGSWYSYQAEQAALEERLAAYEAQQRQDERIAAEQAKRDAAEAAADEAAKRVDASWLIGGWAVFQENALKLEQFTKAGLSLAVCATGLLSFWHQLHTQRAGDRALMPRNLHF